jgi:NADH-quinone oxidoreductase subunit E
MIERNEVAPLSHEQIDEVIARYPGRTGDLLSILETLQEMHPLKYLPCATLARVAERKGLAPSRVFSVATFYSFFNLCPQGRHTVMVCRGTACHTRGSKPLMDGVLAEAGGRGVDSDGSFTTEDHKLTVRTVACFGQCALAPVVSVDEDVLGRVTDMQLRRRVRNLLEKDTP